MVALQGLRRDFSGNCPLSNGTARLLSYRCQPKVRQFDGSISLALAAAIEGTPEEVPGFKSIYHRGVVCECIAYCDSDGKRVGRPVNAWATAPWHMALKRQGYEKGLRRSDGKVADWLAGNVVVVISEPEHR